jgi:hypothetical protein
MAQAKLIPLLRVACLVGSFFMVAGVPLAIAVVAVVAVIIIILIVVVVVVIGDAGGRTRRVSISASAGGKCRRVTS